ncbi:alpha-1,3-arabinosyltransferase XAT3-like [Phragmites australis]|uniref:alpha-1,3-arabinosyltransferase XAT3-like n=1 Tax=Phragmites australis TaxID=29695 RepID=UPI002D781CFF|nr:alpha-1,3-arabinosyltransferase XAT3-like [Phragmites australis]
MKAFNDISRALSESKLAIGLFAGLFLSLVIFFSASPQFGANVFLPGSLENGGEGSPVEEKNDHAPPPEPANRTTESPAVTKQAHEKEPTKSPTNFTGAEIAPSSVSPPLKPICDLSDWRYDGCEMWGDARTASGTNRSLVYFIPPPSQLAAAEAATWSIRSQSRKIVGVREVIVRSLNQSNLQEAPNCTVQRSVPAVVFALGGLTFNFWHAFSDVLVPLFTTARAFGGEVDLVATDTQVWFIRKYQRVLRALSRYEVVELDTDREVRCYPHLIVGLRGHRDFDIDPARAPNNYDMLAFRMFVREAYSLPPPSTVLPSKSGGTKPRLMIILRGGTRRFVNADAIVGEIERAGFDVVRMEPTFAADMDSVSREVDACDVLMGAHGAGLTNMVFLRTGGVVVQVIPWGKMEPYGEGFFGAPAGHMGIRHISYSIAAEESTLYDKYGKDHPVITDPYVFYKNGSNGEIYWGQQNIRLNTTRFLPTLAMVKRLLQE